MRSRYVIAGSVMASRHPDRLGQIAVTDRKGRVVGYFPDRDSALAWCQQHATTDGQRRRAPKEDR